MQKSDLFVECMALSDGHKDISYYGHLKNINNISVGASCNKVFFKAINLSNPLQVHTSVENGSKIRFIICLKVLDR